MKILLVVYDNGSHVNLFPIALAQVAAALRQHGHEVEVYAQDVMHWENEHLEAKLKAEGYDWVGVSMVGGYYQHRKAMELVKVINRTGQRAVGGGHLFSPDPQYFLDRGFWAVVQGEGEIICEDIQPGVNKAKKLIENIDFLPFPAYDLFNVEHYCLKQPVALERPERVMMMESGRGCPFSCNFCYHWEDGFRNHSPAYIAEHVRRLQRDYGITYVSFLDDLLMTSPERTIAVCDALRPLKIRWDCNGRLNFAHEEVLSAMVSAGCRFINWGIESVDDTALKAMNKCLSVDIIERGVRAAKRLGIRQGLNIIWPNVGETIWHLEKDVKFLLEHSDGTQLRTIRPVTPYPGSPLYKQMVEDGRLRGIEDFYTRHTNSDLVAVSCSEKLAAAEIHHALQWANSLLVNDYIDKRKETERKRIDRLYLDHDSTFRGFREV